MPSGRGLSSITNTVTENRASPDNQHCSVNVQTQHACIRESVRSVKENRTSPDNQKCLDNFQTACVHQKRFVCTSNTSCKQSAMIRRGRITTRESVRSIFSTVTENRASPVYQHFSDNVQTYYSCIRKSVRSISNIVTESRASLVNQQCSDNLQTQHPCIRESVRSISDTVTETRTSPDNQKCLDNVQTQHACIRKGLCSHPTQIKVTNPTHLQVSR